MTKEKFNEIMKRNGILAFEVENAIYFVQELLEFQAEETEKTEPYAIITIRNLREAARYVGDLMYDLEDVMEE